MQLDGAVLALLDIDPSTSGAEGAFSRCMSVPAAADAFRLDGRKVSLAEPASFAVEPDSVVGPRLGEAGLRSK